MSWVMSWGRNDSEGETKPQVPWVFLVVAATLVFQQPDLAAPFRDVPRHRCKSPELTQLPCPTFWGFFWNETEHTPCPRCMGCLEPVWG